MSEIQKEFLAEYDKKYSRMQTFLLSIITVILSASLVVGYSQVTTSSKNTAQITANTQTLKYVLDNSVSQKAINMLIESFENQTTVMEKYFPEDIKGGIKEFNNVSANFRSYIMTYNSDLNTRGGKLGQKNK